jgi:1,4-alpha-glucan branching enzyme
LSRPRGELAIVLHTHMPYVEGFGTWPFGEEWLWEAIATCYLPLLELLDAGAPLTLSLTPVLCDQLEAPGIAERFERFIDEVRRFTHAEDTQGLRTGGHEKLACELERSWGEYERALECFRARDGDLLGAFARHVQWTSSATHAVLPLLATDACVRVQVQAGIASYRARFGGVDPQHARPDATGGERTGRDASLRGEWQGGFWLPECAHAPHLDWLLHEAGVRTTCVELTNRFGLGAPGHLRPLRTPSGVVLVPVDRVTMGHVWSAGGYPSSGLYRDYHRHTVHHHQPWANDGSAYDNEHARALAAEHARDFVQRTIERLRHANEEEAGPGESHGPLPDGGLVVCALDTELLGHWWYEGAHWLKAVVEECSRQDLALVRLDEAAALRHPEPVDDSEWGVSTWGRDGDLCTWSGPRVADMAFEARAGELRVLAALERRGASSASHRARTQNAPANARIALRGLLALQASDWPFMVSRGLAVPYARERFETHRDALSGALARGEDSAGGAGALDGGLRNLAPHADPTDLLEP